MGALYVGDNFQETNASRFFHGVFKQFLDAHVRLQTLSKHPRVTLLELLQAEGCQNSDVVKRPAIRQNTAVLMEGTVHRASADGVPYSEPLPKCPDERTLCSCYPRPSRDERNGPLGGDCDT